MDERVVLRRAIDDAVARLAAAGVASPRVDAHALAAHALGVDQLVLANPPAVPADFSGCYAALVGARAGRVPLQHLTGRVRFRHLSLAVRAGVFIPRPETELVAGAAIAYLQPGALAVDLCTGSGAIAVSLAHEVVDLRVIAVDLSPAAVALTEANAEANRVDVRALVGDITDPTLLDDLAGRVDVLVANPPYVPAGEAPLPLEVAEHEPAAALWGGGVDGLDLPAAIVRAAARLLRPGGRLVMEHADSQGRGVAALVTAGGFEDTVVHPDLSGRDRYVTARRVGCGTE